MKNSLRVLKLLMANPGKCYSNSQLCKELELHRVSIIRSLLDLLVAGIVVEHRGRPNTYQFNNDLL